ncbi:MAG: hypothetical protein K2L87_02595, partial [Clostridiales bacterium]|nr:hypothetical protein [Clostridiales bacterium]
MHKKKIRIFLGSSIVEFARERDELDLFIRTVSDKFEEKYDTKIVPLRCETVDGSMTLGRKQEQYNELIKESEMCFFIFFTKAGEFTREEFEVAYRSFVCSDGVKPKIYVYFKNVPDGVEVDPSIKAFMDEIDQTFHHYYGTFDDIDTIKLRILLQLKIQEMDFVKVELEGESVAVDGEKIMKIDGVSEFFNSADLTERLSELQRLNEKYFLMKAEYSKGGCDDAFYREYAEIAARRQTVADEIEELRGQIFSLSVGLSRDEVHGEISLRQREAYRLLEQGDRAGCLAVMAAEEVDGDYFKAKELRRKRHEEEDRAAARTYIREHGFAVDV